MRKLIYSYIYYRPPKYYDIINLSQKLYYYLFLNKVYSGILRNGLSEPIF